nr:PREDICTED: UDP-glucose:glycoprotein glucosyltransferase [Bemisia tabaci]
MEMSPFVLAVLLLLFVASDAKKKPKSVTTVIDAKWEETPVVLEISEFIAEESNDLFWKFVEAVNALEPPLIDLETDKQKYDVAIAVASSLISPARISLLKLSLALHVYSPLIEMYAQMGRQVGIACPTAAVLAGTTACTTGDLRSTLDKLSQGESRLETFRVDHHYPGSENRSITAVLYGELGTPEFTDFHAILKSEAELGRIDYVIRHHVRERPLRRVRLSGYGVELAMKSTEYKAQDDSVVKDGGNKEEEEDEEIEGFNFKRLKSLYPDKSEDLEKFKINLLETLSEMAPLKVWQFQELSLQAAQRILSSPLEDALQTFTHIAQNFPMQARSLVSTTVSSELKSEIEKNKDKFVGNLNLQPQDTALFLNGLFFDMDITDIMTILESIKSEQKIMEGLYSIGVTEEKVFNKLLALDLSMSGTKDYAIDIRDSAIKWVNDIENDKQYKRWSTSLLELLRPTFPGLLRSIKRNLYNLVIICDPADTKSWPLLKLAESFIVHTAPLHVGLLFSVPDKLTGHENGAVALFNAFNYIAEEKDSYKALSFITDVYAAIDTPRDVTPADVKKMLKTRHSDADLEDIFGADTEYNTGRKLAADFIAHSGFRSQMQVLLNGIPLPEKLLNAGDFEEAVLTEIMAQTPTIQKAVYRGDLTDSDDVIDWLMSRPNVMPRLNERILNSEKSNFIDLSNLNYDFIPYLNEESKPSGKPILLTHWIVANLETEAGRTLLQNALTYMEAGGNSRIGLIINPDETSSTKSQIVNKLALASLLHKSNFEVSLPSAKKPIKSVNAILQYAKDLQSAGESLTLQNDIDWDKIDEALKAHSAFVSNTLKLGTGAAGVVTNGRVIGPLDEGETLITDDFALLERYTLSSYTDEIYNVLKKNIEDVSLLTTEVLTRTVSLLVSRPQTKNRFQIPTLDEKHSMIKLPAKNSSQPVFDIVVIVDPVSRGAQKIGPILQVLYQVLNANIRIFFNCVEKNSDMPLKSFYRFVLEPELQFDANGRLSSGPIAKFTNMPGSPLLTQNMHVPENWLVESVASPYDLDNIRLQDVDSTVHSEYELEYLLLEGHCFEATLGNPPRGLQITLGTETQPVMVDTIVMANLGYFQLKANPGMWILRLRQGRSSEIFDIVSHEGSDTPEGSADIKVLISSFRSHVLKLKVQKKPDKLNVDLLGDEDDNKSGIWNSITSTFSASKEAPQEEETINIFSVASGHLYERFLRIMMLSVIKHTKSPVKFWFLKNYLSPILKDFLPKMAKKYNFEYELVQYKWPRWLHQQTEKQRIIWGYKILFLDVLFPLSVKKIIFVDADQVVRADMKELVDLDLGGAPYGYTPFCESRTEMDGFRFWKQGYWRNHLQGRKYHISALYVVDLKRFRKIAAGDRLRGQYQALSQDPNSLSNLDQDLPNNMIHQVAIKSLPQEWLWCETWCDDSTKKKAKTIDLCNNPLTKEAKLTAAMRIIDEWKDYDAEIKQLSLEQAHEEEELVSASADSSSPESVIHSEL